MTKARILRGDVVRFCQLHKALGLPKFHALIADVPYGLSSGGSGKAGFMGLRWDAIDGAAFQVETWKLLADCLHAGAYMFIFAGNLNDDLISVAMRRAGLVKQHKALAWSQGSSLPKTSRIDTRIDAANGNPDARKIFAKAYKDAMEESEYNHNDIDQALGIKASSCYWAREDHRGGLPPRQHWEQVKVMAGLDSSLDDLYIEAEREVVNAGKWDARKSNGIYGDFVGGDETAPATPLAQTWAGHRYGAQALRNLVEAILIFRKPYEGKAYESIVRTGAGALNIEGSRIGANGGGSDHGGFQNDGGMIGGKIKEGEGVTDDTTGQGRHPANFLIQHSEKCIPRGTKRVRSESRAVRRNKGVSGAGWKSIAYPDSKEDAGYADADGLETVSDWQCHESCVVRKLDEQAGERPTGGYPAEGIQRKHNDIYGKPNKTGPQNFGASTGGSSRFVMTADWQHEAFEAIASPASSGTARRIEDANAVRYQSKPSRAERDAGLDGFEAGAANNYSHGVGGRNPNNPRGAVGGARRRVERGLPASLPRKNIHPTTKSISLMKYLCQLLLPPDAYAPRRLFVPFAGVASEIISGMLAGWDEVVGVEIDTEGEYVAIARARIAWWQRQAQYGQTDPAVILANAPPEVNDNGDVQLDLFAPEEPR